MLMTAKDATKAYEPLHPPGTIERYLSKGIESLAMEFVHADDCLEAHKGVVEDNSKDVPEVSSRSYKPGDAIPLMLCMNLSDFERAAKLAIAPRAFAYFHSAADDHITFRRNRADWSKLLLRPRALVDVRNVVMRRHMMGNQYALPIFIAPTAMSKLAHPDGEIGLLSGSVKYNIPYCVSTYSSVSHEELGNHQKQQNTGGLVFQLYVAKDQAKTRKLIRNARKSGFTALMVTIDTPVGGKREEDEFLQAQAAYELGEDEPQRPVYPSPGEQNPILRGAHSSSLSWNDIEWIKQEWSNTGPVYLKGIQTVEDAALALRYGVQGIYLSNHGARQLETGSSSLRTLMEIRAYCPKVLQKLEVFLDGGVLRGTDVIKAVSLGATAVGIGRPFIYALGAYGADGVKHAMQSKYHCDEAVTAARKSLTF